MAIPLTLEWLFCFMIFRQQGHLWIGEIFFVSSHY
jgi:hypothetical protein